MLRLPFMLRESFALKEKDDSAARSETGGTKDDNDKDDVDTDDRNDVIDMPMELRELVKLGGGGGGSDGGMDGTRYMDAEDLSAGGGTTNPASNSLAAALLAKDG